jgi:DNA-binding NtrC family response regulator
VSLPSVLVVDDDVNLVQGLELALRREYSVFTAVDAAGAFRVLAAEPVDIVLADYRIPGMDGLEFLRIVRNRSPDTVRIVLTGHVSAEVAIRAMNEAEVYRFLEKPVDRNELLVTLYLAHEKLKLERENRRLYGLIHGDPEHPVHRVDPFGQPVANP